MAMKHFCASHSLDWCLFEDLSTGRQVLLRACIGHEPCKQLGYCVCRLIALLVQLTLSADHYTYVAPGTGARFEDRVATPGRHVKVRSQSCAPDRGDESTRTCKATALMTVSGSGTLQASAWCKSALRRGQDS